MKISVIIPTADRCGTLARTLPTVLAQDLPTEDYEVVVVVDGSSDGTIEALEKVERSAALTILQQPRRGPAAARNAGLKVARGELVLFLDDDILCGPELLGLHLAAHEGRPRLLAHGPIFLAPESPDSLVAEGTKRWYEEYNRRILTGHGLDLPSETLLASNSSIRRSLLLDIGGFDENIPSKEDSELGIRLWKMGVPFLFIPEATAHEIFVKSTSAFLLKDVRMWGRAELAICRKHPDYRAYSPLARVRHGPLHKRLLRRVAATSPISPMPALIAGVRIAERLRWIPGSRRAGMRLMHLGQTIGLFRGAAEEAGSWRSLQREFAT
jgi:glycosyltransferase involved in cell wall biosynthesis